MNRPPEQAEQTELPGSQHHELGDTDSALADAPPLWDTPADSPLDIDFISGVETEDVRQPSSHVLNDAIEHDQASEPSPPPRSGPPRVDEWQHFFSRIVIGTLTDFYVTIAFRGIDEDRLTEKETEMLIMRKEERDSIARPLAEFANKTPYLRKRGRLIVSSAASVESLVALGMWFSRVNRIARKYRANSRTRTVRGNANVSNGSNAHQANANGNGSSPAERTGFSIYNPGSG